MNLERCQKIDFNMRVTLGTKYNQVVARGKQGVKFCTWNMISPLSVCAPFTNNADLEISVLTLAALQTYFHAELSSLRRSLASPPLIAHDLLQRLSRSSRIL